MKGLINGAHTIINSTDPDADRAFFRDVLGFESVDAGGGWLIFALPPGEVAIHPGENGRHELYLMSADLEATLAESNARVSWSRCPSSSSDGGAWLRSSCRAAARSRFISPNTRPRATAEVCPPNV